jgi:hypothetical protein
VLAELARLGDNWQRKRCWYILCGNDAAHTQASAAADVRIAWGEWRPSRLFAPFPGTECEDIVLGPPGLRLSIPGGY